MRRLTMSPYFWFEDRFHGMKMIDALHRIAQIGDSWYILTNGTIETIDGLLRLSFVFDPVEPDFVGLDNGRIRLTKIRRGRF